MLAPCLQGEGANNNISWLHKNTYTLQWRIQNFLEGRVNPKGGEGANLLFDHSPQKKNYMKNF